MKKIIRWSEEKNQLLQLQRGLSFELVVERLECNEIIGRKSHPNKKKYPHQQVFILELKGYVCYVPFVEDATVIFLKTIIPSRKLNREYGSKGNE